MGPPNLLVQSEGYATMHLNTEAMVLGNCQFRGVLLVWIKAGHESTVLTLGADGGCWIFLEDSPS